MDSRKIARYIEDWRGKGYAEDIPDEVPLPLMRLNLAPSYQAICLAILRNDTALASIGYTPPKSQYYYALKGMKLSEPKPAKEKVHESEQQAFEFS